ncbi:SDR family oxidoreductase [Dryocola sp. BD626]|uniref:SDR family oxidoreductase n=1 Tax=Dryocola sp. BD626 TaxID=3133273 RepID=UPI003F4FB8E6
MKTFLSIGTGPGMGYETAARFAKEGFRVVLAARQEEKLRQMADALQAQGYTAEFRIVDARNAESISRLISQTEAEFGAIDVLHYNAAVMRNESITSQPQGSFVDDLAINIGGALTATQSVLPVMSKRGAGTILLTGGGFALYPDPEFLSLSIGKAGIRNMAFGLFDTLKKQGIHIASITVSTVVAPDSKEARDVGNQFWDLHNQSTKDWSAEATYPG